MKTKKFNKKLTINKKTIADLSRSHLDSMHGGGITDSNLTVVCCSMPLTICADATCAQGETCHLASCFISCDVC